MYERNAIVIDRYFANLFGYDQNNNLKNNSINYFELVNKVEQFQIASENENNIILEYEKVAGQIKETQKLQDVLNKRNAKYSEGRKSLFDNLEETANVLSKKFEKIGEDIQKNDEEIKNNIEKFVAEIKEFHEKSDIRTEYGRQRRIVEGDYQAQLTSTIDNFEKINKDKLNAIKIFAKSDRKNEEKNKIREKILKNGAKEKVPFDLNVVNQAIDVATDIETRKVEILLSLYDKTGKLLDEIKNDSIKIDRHKKIVKDSKSKLEYLNVISEYVIYFLDNERMSTAGGEKEHEKIMIESCESVQNDLIQIQNMYSLLLREITDKSSKKAYKELYNLGYLFDLEDSEKEFEKNISKLNMAGSIIYPDHWRVEGMQKLYDTFRHIITDVYGKDISEFEPLDITSAINKDIINIDDEKEDVKISKMKTDYISSENTEEKQDVEEINSSTEEFQWDDDDVNEELTFVHSERHNLEEDDDLEDEDDELDYKFEFDDNVGKNEETFEDDDKVEDSVEQEEKSIEVNPAVEENDDEKRDKEIDKILGFFDDDGKDENEDTLEEDFDDENFDIDDEDDVEEHEESDEIDDDDRILDDIDDDEDDIDEELDLDNLNLDDVEDEVSENEEIEPETEDLIELEDIEKEEKKSAKRKSNKKTNSKKKEKDEEKKDKKKMSLFGRRKK